jgi:hypothetical protein
VWIRGASAGMPPLLTGLHFNFGHKYGNSTGWRVAEQINSLIKKCKKMIKVSMDFLRAVG